MVQLILITASTVFFFMVFFYIIAQLLKNNGIVDIGWGLGFITILAILHIFYPELYLRKILITAMVVLWGFRLSVHIFLRSLGKPEDFRYANWRRKWGKRAFIMAFFKVFMLQGLVMIVIAMPVMLIFNSNPVKYTVFDIGGTILFLVGFYFEAMSDYQLTEFRKKPENKGKIITSGLWKYTRHPNYFGDALVWWGMGIVALPVEWGFAGLVSPLLMTYLLVNVSGVPMLEKKYAGRDDWEAYKQQTPMFVPKFGKKRFH
jgi:steroid 5-alpha reductase family enzyme